MQDIEARDPDGRSIEQILRDLYVTRAMTVDEVGAQLGVTAGAVSRWLERCGIAARPRGGKATAA